MKSAGKPKGIIGNATAIVAHLAGAAAKAIAGGANVPAWLESQAELSQRRSKRYSEQSRVKLVTEPFDWRGGAAKGQRGARPASTYRAARRNATRVLRKADLEAKRRGRLKDM